MAIGNWGFKGFESQLPQLSLTEPFNGIATMELYPISSRARRSLTLKGSASSLANLIIFK